MLLVLSFQFIDLKAGGGVELLPALTSAALAEAPSLGNPGWMRSGAGVCSYNCCFCSVSKSWISLLEKEWSQFRLLLVLLVLRLQVLDL